MSLGPFLPLMLLLGSAPPSGARPSEQDGHSLAPSTDPSKEVQGIGSGPEIEPRQAGQPQAVQQCPPQAHPTLEAFSRMAASGVFSVWDITKSVTLSSEAHALRSFIVYHAVHPRNPSGAQVILQVELTDSASGELQHVTEAWLEVESKRLQVKVWQEPASVGGGLRLLVESFVDLHKLQTVPHLLSLIGGEGGSVPFAILDNIRLR